MESYCSLCTFKVPQGANNLILCTLDTIHRLFFDTRLIINKINKVQWVDFKLENVLVSLHSLKTMDLGLFGTSAPLSLRNGELLGHSPILNGVKVTDRDYWYETDNISWVIRELDIIAQTYRAKLIYD
jgi:hypothetical protein